MERMDLNRIMDLFKWLVRCVILGGAKLSLENCQVPLAYIMYIIMSGSLINQET